MARDKQEKKKIKGSFGRLHLPVAPDYVRPTSRRWPAIVAALALTVVVVAIAFASFVTDRSVLSPGNVSSAHASFEASCTACHESPAWNVSRAALDAKCVDCHESRRNPGAFSLATHAEYRSGDVDRRALSVDEPSCAACHDEHRGRAHDVLDTTDRSCATCHAFGTFEDGHPEFTRVDAPDPAGLRFPHTAHVREIVRRKELTPAELSRACLHCHETLASGETFAPIDFDRHCGACHLNGGTPTHWLRVTRDDDTPGVRTLETLLASGAADGAALATTSASGFQDRDRGRSVRKRNVEHLDPWITANLRRLRNAMFPEQTLTDLLAASGDVPDGEAQAIYEEAIASLRAQARELRRAPVRDVQRDLDAIEQHIETLERRIQAPETALDLAPFSIDAGDRNPSMPPERFARFEAFVDTLTASCATCHLVENATIARVQTDQGFLDRARFDHGAHELQRSCVDCHDRIDLSVEAVFGDAEVDPTTDHAGIQNLPDKTSCTACHRSERVASSCTSCHDYHPDKIQRTRLVLGGE